MNSSAWSFITLAATFLFSTTACTQNWSSKPGVDGEGPNVTKTLDIAAFDGFNLAIDATVMVQQGNSQSVKIDAQQNVIDNLKKEVKDGVWKIGFNKNVKNHSAIKIWVTVPSLNEIGVSGNGDVIGEGNFKNLGELSLAISGSGKIKLNADSEKLNVAISGSGGMDLAGATGESNISISGSGNISAFDLTARSCNVRISGSGDSSVNVSESLEVAIAGSGDVFYKGKPSVRSKVSGSGEVSSK